MAFMLPLIRCFDAFLYAIYASLMLFSLPLSAPPPCCHTIFHNISSHCCRYAATTIFRFSFAMFSYYAASCCLMSCYAASAMLRRQIHNNTNINSADASPLTLRLRYAAISRHTLYSHVLLFYCYGFCYTLFQRVHYRHDDIICSMMRQRRSSRFSGNIRDRDGCLMPLRARALRARRTRQRLARLRTSSTLLPPC